MRSCGAVRCSAVRCDVAWHGVVRCGAVWVVEGVRDGGGGGMREIGERVRFWRLLHGCGAGG